MAEIKVVQEEIRRLSLRIAVARYDLEVAILNGVPIKNCENICKEISICLLQKSALERNAYKELPYNIRLLYKE